LIVGYVLLIKLDHSVFAFPFQQIQCPQAWRGKPYVPEQQGKGEGWGGEEKENDCKAKPDPHHMKLYGTERRITYILLRHIPLPRKPPIIGPALKEGGALNDQKRTGYHKMNPHHHGESKHKEEEARPVQGGHKKN
jgi:hypothetical protein